MHWKHPLMLYMVPFLLVGGSLAIITNAAIASGINGHINMKGAIVETPCAIDVGDQEQTLMIGNFPISQIIRDGQGVEKEFSIRLFDCVLTSLAPPQSGWKHFQVTFEGDADNGNFKTIGDANGVAIMIRDQQGNIAVPGAPLPKGEITPGNMQLRYTLNLVGNKENLRAGSYSSTIRFRMDYN
ncbi:fimbrial protein [Serratia ureilytica]|uniref:fimbrial protein n=1 Tax=Serratia ureilytica TaxID=300181 RepID=UPI00313CA0B2